MSSCPSLTTGLLAPLLLVALAVANLAAQQEDDVSRLQELLQQLPVLPEVPPQEAEQLPFDPAGLEATGMQIRDGSVILRATAVVDQGPVDGLEVMLCFADGKVHESYARTAMSDARLLKAGFLAAFNLPDGKPAPEDSGVPARGWPLAITVWWRPDPDFEPKRWLHLPLSSLVRDRLTNRPYPAMPYLYTGSREAVIDQSVPGQDGLQSSNRFMLEITKSVVVNFDEPDALLASFSPLARWDDRFEVRSDVAPASGSRLYFIFERVGLPLCWELDEQGTLRSGHRRLDRDLAIEALRQSYDALPVDAPRALAIRTPAMVSDARVQACRLQALEWAVAAEINVLPIFVPGLVWQHP